MVTSLQQVECMYHKSYKCCFSFFPKSKSCRLLKKKKNGEITKKKKKRKGFDEPNWPLFVWWTQSYKYELYFCLPVAIWLWLHDLSVTSQLPQHMDMFGDWEKTMTWRTKGSKPMLSLSIFNYWPRFHGDAKLNEIVLSKFSSLAQYSRQPLRADKHGMRFGW